MTIQTNEILASNRNAFVALCDYAYREGWCSAIFCTTCGHEAFDRGFSKIIHGENPDDPAFWPDIKNNDTSASRPGLINPYKVTLSQDDQLKLANIVASAKLSDLKAVAEFPKWINYIGLALHQLDTNESKKVLSDSLIPQFISLVESDNEIYNHLQGKIARHKPLALKDLSKIQNSLR